jgi:hypothetical protein
MAGTVPENPEPLPWLVAGSFLWLLPEDPGAKKFVLHLEPGDFLPEDLPFGTDRPAPPDLDSTERHPEAPPSGHEEERTEGMLSNPTTASHCKPPYLPVSESLAS